MLQIKAIRKMPFCGDVCIVGGLLCVLMSQIFPPSFDQGIEPIVQQLF
jgi:hypothetical protein